jgi:hypothetical protein
MIFQRLRVFVSSRIQELAPERQAIRLALEELKVDAWVFEQDAGARPVSIEKAFLEEVQAADLYIGLFWKGYGAYTIEEYDHARQLGKDCLIYEKRAGLEEERDPRLQEFLDRVGNVETGLAIKRFDDPVELSEAIKDDVARWQARIVRQRSAPRIPLSLSLAETRERDQLLILLRKVKQFWIEGVLEKSVHGEALIELGKEVWSETHNHPWEQIVELPDQKSRSLRPGESIGELFEGVGRSLLILGAPGSGKTITLLELACNLIMRAENDPAHPIPVVFNLSSRSDPKQNFLDWLLSEMQVKYQVPKKIASRWLDENWIVPLLDGLDEIVPENQSACVKAINAYMQNHGAPGIAVCSRFKEYTALPVRLGVMGAICLKPLRPEQIKEYLAGAGLTFAGLKAALAKDRFLLTLAETPLMLDVMAVAYRDLSADELTGQVLKDENGWRTHLFDAYIEKMFTRKGKAFQAYPRDRTLRWLGWIARRMQQHSQAIFLIEQLQPSWLAAYAARLVYFLASRLVFGLLAGFIFGVIVGLRTGVVRGLSSGLFIALLVGIVPGLIDNWRLNRGSIRTELPKAHRHWQTVINIFVFGIGISLSIGVIGGGSLGLAMIFATGMEVGSALGYGLGVALSIGFYVGVIGGLFWGFRSSDRMITSDVHSVESLYWSRTHAQSACLKGLMIGLACGSLVGLLFGILGPLGFSPRFGLISGLNYALLGTLVGGLFGGLRASILDVKAVPNLGIRLSLRNAVLTAGLGLLVIGLPAAFLGALAAHLSGGLLFGLDFGLVLGLITVPIAFLWFGGQDVLQHCILRLILYWKGDAPLRYANFLDHAARLVFLQKVGGGYIFIHRLLLEHLSAKCIHEATLASGAKKLEKDYSRSLS